MSIRTESVELTNMCMVQNGNDVLILHRNKGDWDGICFPGGHVEKEESVVDSVIREIQEETGLRIDKPVLCGITHFFAGHRYIVFLFRTSVFEGDIISSSEGKVEWIPLEDIRKQKLAANFEDVLEIYLNDDIQELYYDMNGDCIFK